MKPQGVQMRRCDTERNSKYEVQNKILIEEFRNCELRKLLNATIFEFLNV